MLRAYKTPIFAKGQKLTHSRAHAEKHAGQETPLLYTPYLQWHHPGGRALLQLAQAPTSGLPLIHSRSSGWCWRTKSWVLMTLL